MQWHKMRVEEDQIPSIKETFDSLFLAAGCPRGAAIFLCADCRHGGSVELYFSPEAYSIANILVIRHRGTPCDKPEPIFSFLAGYGYFNVIRAVAD